VKKVLIVDDEDDVRLFLQDFLEERRLDVSSAASGEEALEIAEKNPPDIVLLDLMMPGMNGLECLEKLLKKNPSAKVIMLTALNDDVSVEKSKQLGARHYILKPFSLAYLETELVKLIGA